MNTQEVLDIRVENGVVAPLLIASSVYIIYAVYIVCRKCLFDSSKDMSRRYNLWWAYSILYAITAITNIYSLYIMVISREISDMWVATIIIMLNYIVDYQEAINKHDRTDIRDKQQLSIIGIISIVLVLVGVIVFKVFNISAFRYVAYTGILGIVIAQILIVVGIINSKVQREKKK